ncbi:MAG: tRNA 2-thiocytidine biosynthesis protein TtcA [Eubacterium sp.]|nr:tRNA 2-thiocytidine biosynthesis protein TtcA [Eubacterium sp.]
MSTKQEEIEKSIQKHKRYHKVLFSSFTKAINRYELLSDGDRVAVCISGGKDSMIMAKLFQELKHHRKMNFDTEFIVMDPGYKEENRRLIEENGKTMGIPLKFFDSTIFDTVFEIEKNPCYLCARMRRGYLYAKAKELGCNKIALGHHYDDVIETILMSMIYGGQIQTMMPKLKSQNFEGMELIRPMYLVREEDIIAFSAYHDLKFLRCACRFTEKSLTDSGESKRLEVKELIKALKDTNPFVESNIFKSVENVHLDTVISYKSRGEKHSFLEDY